MAVEQDGSKLSPGGGGKSTPVADTVKEGFKKSISDDDGAPPRRSDQSMHSHSTARALSAESQNDSTIRSRKEEEERQGESKLLAKGRGSTQESTKESNMARASVKVIDMQSSLGCLRVEDEDYLKSKVLLTSFSSEITETPSSQPALKEAKQSLSSAGISVGSPVFKKGGPGVSVHELSKDESVHKAMADNINTSEQIEKKIEEDKCGNCQQEKPDKSGTPKAILVHIDQDKVGDSELYKHPIVLTEETQLSESLETFVRKLSKDESTHKAITENNNISEQIKENIDEDNCGNCWQEEHDTSGDVKASLVDRDQAKEGDFKLYKHPIVLTEERKLSESLETSVHKLSKDEYVHKAISENTNTSEQIEKNIEEDNHVNCQQPKPDKSGDGKAILVDTDQAKVGDLELYKHPIVLSEGRKLSESSETSVCKLSKDESAHMAIARNICTSEEIEKNIEEENHVNCRQEEPDKSGDAKVILVDRDQAKEGNFKLHKHPIVLTEGRNISESLETSVHKLSKDEYAHKAISENTNTSEQIEKNIEEDNCVNHQQQKPDKSGDAKAILVDTDQAKVGDLELYKHPIVLTEGRKLSDSSETSMCKLSSDESAHMVIIGNISTSEEIKKNIEEENHANCRQEEPDKSDVKAILVDTDHAKEGDSRLYKHPIVLTEGRKLSESSDTSAHKLSEDESSHKAITEDTNNSERIKKNIDKENRVNCQQQKPDKSGDVKAILVDTDQSKVGDSELSKQPIVLTEGRMLSESLETSVCKSTEDESAGKTIAENINNSEEIEKNIEEDNHINCRQEEPNKSGDAKVILVDTDQGKEGDSKLYKNPIVLTEGKKLSESLETSAHKLSEDESSHKAIAENTKTSEQIEKNIEEDNCVNCQQQKPDKSGDAKAILVDTDQSEVGDSESFKHLIVLTEGRKLSVSLETSVCKSTEDESAKKAIAENINSSEEVEKNIEEDNHVNCQQDEPNKSDAKAILVDIDQAKEADFKLYKHPIVLIEGRKLSESLETSVHKLSEDEYSHKAIAENTNSSEQIEKSIKEDNGVNHQQQKLEKSGDVKAILVDTDQSKVGNSESSKHSIVLTEGRNISESSETCVHKLSKDESAHKAVAENINTSEQIEKNIDEDSCVNCPQEEPDKSGDRKAISVGTDQAKEGDSKLYKHPIVLAEGRKLSESSETSVHKLFEDESAHKAITESTNTSEQIEKNIEEDNSVNHQQQNPNKSGDAKAILVDTDQAKVGDSELYKHPIVLTEGRNISESSERCVHKLSKDESAHKAISENINTAEAIKKSIEEDNCANCPQEEPDKSGDGKAILVGTDQAKDGDSKLYKCLIVLTEGRKLLESLETSVHEVSKDETVHKAIAENINTSERIKTKFEEENLANCQQEKPNKSGTLKVISEYTDQDEEGDSKLCKHPVVLTEGRKCSESSETSVHKLSKDESGHKAIPENINTSEKIKNRKEDDRVNYRQEKPDKSVTPKVVLVGIDQVKQGDSKLYKRSMVLTEGRKISESSRTSVRKLTKDNYARKAISENINTSERIEKNCKEDERANCRQEKPTQGRHSVDKSVHSKAILVQKDKAKKGDSKLYKHPIVQTEGRKLSKSSEMSVHTLSKDESVHEAIDENIKTSEKNEKSHKEDKRANCLQEKPTKEMHLFDKSVDAKAILVDEDQAKEGDSKLYKHPIVQMEGRKLLESSEMSVHKLPKDESAHKPFAENINMSEKFEKNIKEDNCASCWQEKSTQERHPFDKSVDTNAILVDKYQAEEGDSKLSKNPMVLSEGRKLSESSEMSVHALSKDESAHKAIADSINTSDRIEKNRKEDDCVNCWQDKPTKERHSFDKSDVTAISLDKEQSKEGDSKLSKHPIVLSEERMLSKSSEMSAHKLSKEESVHNVNTSEQIEFRSPAEKNHKEDDRANCRQEKPTKERYPIDKSGDVKAILVGKDKAKEGDSKLYQHPIVLTEGRKLSESSETSVLKLSEDESVHKAIAANINTSEKNEKSLKEDDCVNYWQEKPTQERHPFDESGDAEAILLNKDRDKEGDSKLYEHPIVLREGRKFSESLETPVHKLPKDESAHKAIADNINTSERFEKKQKEDDRVNCKLEKPTQERHSFDKSGDVKPISLVKDQAKEEDSKLSEHPIVLTEGRKFSESSEIPVYKISKDESAHKAIADNIIISERFQSRSPAAKRSKEDNCANCWQEKSTQGHPVDKSDVKAISVDKDEVEKENYKAYKLPVVLTEGRKLLESSEILDSQVAQLQQACDSDTLSVAYPPSRQQVIEISELQQGSRASWGGCCGMVDWLLKK